jgi:hypothetical protein
MGGSMRERRSRLPFDFAHYVRYAQGDSVYVRYGQGDSVCVRYAQGDSVCVRYAQGDKTWYNGSHERATVGRADRQA